MISRNTLAMLALAAVTLLPRIAAAQGPPPPIGPPLPPIPVPAENPITEEKRILGKILFWDRAALQR